MLRLVVLAMTVASLAREVSSKHGPFSKTHVVIKNNMGDGSDIKVHCVSKNDDLNKQVVKDGQSYEFTFKPSLKADTQFSCTCDSNVGWTAFDAYVQGDWWKNKCKVCEWDVNKTGVFSKSKMDGFMNNPWATDHKLNSP